MKPCSGGFLTETECVIERDIGRFRKTMDDFSNASCRPLARIRDRRNQSGFVHDLGMLLRHLVRSSGVSGCALGRAVASASSLDGPGYGRDGAGFDLLE